MIIPSIPIERSRIVMGAISLPVNTHSCNLFRDSRTARDCNFGRKLDQHKDQNKGLDREQDEPYRLEVFHISN